MINSIPVIGWFISLLVSISLAVPFWLVWTIFDIGEYYFDFLPSQWQSIPFWDCVGLFIVGSIIRLFSPFYIYNNSTAKVTNE